MYTSNFRPQGQTLIPILNYNRIEDNQKRDAIKAMGMSACQVGCMGSRRGPTKYCSAH